MPYTDIKSIFRPIELNEEHKEQFKQILDKYLFDYNESFISTQLIDLRHKIERMVYDIGSGESVFNFIKRIAENRQITLKHRILNHCRTRSFGIVKGTRYSEVESLGKGHFKGMNGEAVILSDKDIQRVSRLYNYLSKLENEDLNTFLKESKTTINIWFSRKIPVDVPTIVGIKKSFNNIFIVNIVNSKGSLLTEYWDSESRYVVYPSKRDVLETLNYYEYDNFDYYCSDFGFDKDSIKALKSYNEHNDMYNKMKVLFTDNELDELNEIINY